MKKSFVAVGCLGLLLSFGMAFGQGKGKGGKGAPVAGDAAKGKDLFASNCGVCHKADSEDRVVGPGLKGLYKHAMLVNGKPVNDANVMVIINEGTQQGMPGFAVPTESLSGAERAHIVAYLKTL